MSKTTLLVMFLFSALVIGACQCGGSNGNNTNKTLAPEGEGCQTDDECVTGRCVTVPGEANPTCRRDCQGGCNKGETCTAFDADTSGAARGACVAEREGLCLPCNGDKDCPYAADACIVVDGAHVCGRDCSVDGKCPDGYVCKDSTDVDGRAVPRQCVPNSGSCDCRPATTGQKRPCQVKNALGTCAGQETCDGLHGYMGCDAPIPASETCDGVDNDCNGMVDDKIAAIECGLGECHTSVPGCTDGKVPTCTPLPPSAEVCNGKDDDCNGKIDETFDFDTDPANCGGCGMACVIDHGSPACQMKACRVGTCDMGWADCNETPTDGCESELASDPLNCGACKKPCSLAFAVPACRLAKCAVSSCLQGHYDINRDPKDGCEYACLPTNGAVEKCDGVDNDCNNRIDEGFDLQTDVLNCGGCGKACVIPRGTPACVTGKCAVGMCDKGRADCNGVVGDGCETDTDTSVANCGACNVACAPDHAAGACVAGKCEVKTCDAGFADCDGDPKNGCEVDTRTDPDNCNACQHKCVVANAAAACVAGQCAVGSCTAPFGDCNGDVADGCETDTSTDAQHCGSCAGACAVRAGSAASCVMSQCAWTCVGPFQDCNGVAADGCESNKNTDVENCGTCGTSCPVQANAAKACNAGVCGATCNAPFADCNGQGTDGCEIDTSTDAEHCGACGTSCPARDHSAKTCASSTCGYACTAPWLDCNGVATDGCETDGLDITNCGACNNVCAPRPNALPKCTATGCGFSCNPNFQDCNGDATDGCESDARSDVKNCGACNVVCQTRPHSKPVCSSGGCGYVCDPGWNDCDGVAANGCESEAATDADNCGGCGMAFACPFKQNATRTCVMGQCQSSCIAPFAECTPGAGCVVNTDTDADNCGSCGGACSTNHQSVACVKGQCKGACDPGYDDCDGDARKNGCEVSLQTDPLNCNACGRKCSTSNISSPSCTAGVCDGACSANYGDCDTNKLLNGCETDLTLDTKNCGGCGVTCSSNHNAPVCQQNAGGSWVCGGTCSMGYEDCNNDKAKDGCETDINNDADHCGKCSTVCAKNTPSGNAICGSGLCTTPCGVKINEVATSGPNGGNDKFVELFNNCPAGSPTISLAGWRIAYRAANGNQGSDTVLSGSIAPGGYQVYGGSAYLRAKDGVLASGTLAAAGGGIALEDTSLKIIDSVAYDVTTVDPHPFQETLRAPHQSNSTGSIVRLPNGVDTNVNKDDFKNTAMQTPGAANQ